MPQYRLFLVDRNNHIVGATERRCAASDIKIVALDALQGEACTVDGVEVWHGGQRRDHVKRG